MATTKKIEPVKNDSDSDEEKNRGARRRNSSI